MLTIIKLMTISGMEADRSTKEKILDKAQHGTILEGRFRTFGGMFEANEITHVSVLYWRT